MSRSAQDRIADILAAIKRCQQYEPYLRSDEFASMAYDAVLRNLAVIGEAVRSLPSEARDQFPDIPWAAIIRLSENAWSEFTLFLRFDRKLRRIVCTTNAIKSVNARIRKAVKVRGHPSSTT